MASSTALVGVVGAAVWRGRTPVWARGPKLRDGHPVLRMPVRAGLVVLCQQGNASPRGYTHSGGNCLYALDLSNCSEDVVEIVAAAPGRVAYVYGDSTPGDSNAGMRFGNQVKVDHGGGYFTFYSHLDKVTVREGELVRNGDPLGTMGSTGAAGNRHLHFSLHQGEARDMGVADSIPMRSLVTANVSRNYVFQSTPSEDFMGGQLDLWNGRIYGSENAPDAYVVDGLPRAELLEPLQASYERLAVIVEHRKRLDELAQAWQAHDATWAKEQLDPILARTPRHAVARYWFGTAVQMAQKQWVDAERMFEDLLTRGMGEATWEMWLRSWIHNRYGVMALEQKRPEAALTHFQTALQWATAVPERDFAAGHIKELGAVGR